MTDYLRNAVWLLGLGLITFGYFISHYFLPLNLPTILYVMVPLLLPSLVFYFKTNGYKSLLHSSKGNILPLLVILALLPQIFIKSSQPPYVWDEMAYHYISPFTLFNEKVWNMGSSFYLNLPRLLDTAYISLFSITKTYSIARLLQFSIFMTLLISIYSFLRKNLSLVMAFAFFLISIAHPENHLVWSTFGYIDIGTTSFVLIGLVCLADYLLNKKITNIYFALVFFSMAIGTKYSALSQFLTFVIIAVFLMFKNRQIKMLNFKKITIFVLIFLIFGGYWYVKNLIHTGNPIYPLLFGCKFTRCENVDLGWTIPLTVSNIPIILSKLFVGNKIYELLFLASTFVSITLMNKNPRKLIIFILIYTFIEILLIRNISGYDARYFYHWQIISTLLLVTPLSIVPNLKLFHFNYEK